MKGRDLSDYIIADLEKKIVIITGPRQCGKTTLARSLYSDYRYLNYDSMKDRQAIRNYEFDQTSYSVPIVIFDELHKMHRWKQFLKGVYDTQGIPPRIVVTGSAKMDTFRKVGDSLAGRFFKYQLHPYDIKELMKNDPAEIPADILDRIIQWSGFPEPYENADTSFYRRWEKSHIDIILRQDLIDLTVYRDIDSIETLIQLLRKRVGNPVSYASLARDLQYSAVTIKKWLTLLEDLFIIFKVTPYHKNIARSLLKEPKYYFYNTAYIDGDDGVKFENAVACMLLKEIHRLRDTQGRDVGLYYLRDRNGKEVDFCVNIDNKYTLIEAKLSDTNLSANLSHFRSFFNAAECIQLVKQAPFEKVFPNGIILSPAAEWLANMPQLSRFEG